MTQVAEVATSPIEAHVEVAKSLEPFVASQLHWLKPADDTWQPSDLLPDLTVEAWSAQIERLRAGTQGLSDEVLVVLVGDTITEEALPAYLAMFNRHEGVKDETGSSDSPWAQWSRGWTAEENRHGDLLNKYLYLSGRVNMRAVELTTQHLIANGFNSKTDNDPYCGLIYTAFQERATRVSHGNVARLAHAAGDPLLGKICTIIAGDEARHEEAYKRFVGKILEMDTAGGALAFAQMMKMTITMPACLMSHGHAENLFGQFSSVAQRIGVYTAHDYAQIMQHLIEYWRIPLLKELPPEAARAQEYLCRLPRRYRRLADRIEEQTAQLPRTPSSWIFGRSV